MGPHRIFSSVRSAIPALLILLLAGCAENEWRKKADDPAFLHSTLKAITDRIVFDIFSPPVASRIYAYTTIATYEAARHGDSTLVTLSGQLNGLGQLPQPESGKEYQFNIAAVQAMYRTGKALVFSEEDLEGFYDSLSKEIRKTGIPKDVLERSLAFGDSVSAAVLKWAATDNYRQTRSFPKYTIQRDESTWKPTPPAYMDAVEPHWNKIRPFVLDSAAQFRPEPPVPFSTQKNSAFYQLALEVRDVVANLSPQQKEIASFWDCNPFMMNVNGHVMFANKKISPGGHWVNITAQVSRSLGLSPARASEAYVRVSVALADAFISCWDEKYRSKLIRPESYINQYIDENWVPYLQTPPFPEHTSGHSTISGSAAAVLTDLFGNSLAFSDSTETEFGIPVRKFASFRAAAEEASVSRLYGGIHYRTALDVGLDMGSKVGHYVASRVKTRNSAP